MRFFLITILIIIFSSCQEDSTVKSVLKDIKGKIKNTKPLPKGDYTVNYINKNSIIGIDISHHQKKINWSEVKKWKNHDIKFIYIKASEGSTGKGSKDPLYKQNIDVFFFWLFEF